MTTAHLEFTCTADEPDPTPSGIARATTVTDAATPNLADYDVILVNSSAGKDSQASLDVVAEQGRAAEVWTEMSSCTPTSATSNGTACPSWPTAMPASKPPSATASGPT